MKLRLNLGAIYTRTVRSLRDPRTLLLLLATLAAVGLFTPTAFARLAGIQQPAADKPHANPVVHPSIVADVPVASASHTTAADNTTGTTPPAKASSNTSAATLDPTVPTPDKLPIPKRTTPLVISPSSITLYQRPYNAMGVKSSITTSVPVTVSSSDSKPMNFPNSDMSAGFMLTADSFTVRPTWNMTAAGNYAKVGSFDMAINAIAGDGSANYTGTLHITVLPLPIFSIASAGLTANAAQWQSAVTITGFPGVAYSNGLTDTDKPALTITSGDGLQLINATYDAGSISFTVVNPHYYRSFYNLALVFENKYQQISIPATLNITN